MGNQTKGTGSSKPSALSLKPKLHPQENSGRKTHIQTVRLLVQAGLLLIDSYTLASAFFSHLASPEF